MATELDYRDYIRRKGRRELLDLLPVIEGRARPDDFGAEGWDPGKGFEYLVLRAFEFELPERGRHDTVAWPYPVSYAQLLGPVAAASQHPAEQIDGAIYVGGLACLVQSKTVSEPDFNPVALLGTQLRRRPAAVIGAVFSLHPYTRATVTLARFIVPQTVLLWQGEEFVRVLRILGVRGRASVEVPAGSRVRNP